MSAARTQHHPARSSGVSCPVTSSTDGKEIAHELLNDGCAVGFNKWTTVTITA